MYFRSEKTESSFKIFKQKSVKHHILTDFYSCRQHIEEQTNAISEAIRNNDDAALEKARARKAKSEEREAALRTEYRRLKKRRRCLPS